MNISNKSATLFLEDGKSFSGISIGKTGTFGGEICFNTGMTGYQEIYTDPSYHSQIVVTTNTHIGNYGIHKNESESTKMHIVGIVVNQLSNNYSRLQAYTSLDDYLKTNNVIGIAEIDTRALVSHIRNNGEMNALISTEELTYSERKNLFADLPSMVGLELSSKACCDTPYSVGDENSSTKVAVLDLGCKKSILENLTNRNAHCRVFPAKTLFEVMNEWFPDGFLISNGPGDPSVMQYAVDTVNKCIATGKPVFGICLGQQIIALANGISTYKMHHGHHGCNHPVKNIITQKCEITSQNHGFGISESEVKKKDNVEITHINLNDGTVEGIRMTDKPVFSVQYHPEASPGPHDSHYLFDQFLTSINK